MEHVTNKIMQIFLSEDDCSASEMTQGLKLHKM